jgi:dTMP kinase
MSEKLGKIIMWDSGDGTGKTTNIRLVREKLHTAGHDVFVTRAHGGTPIGEKLRDISLSKKLARTARTDLFISMAIHSELQPKIRHFSEAGSLVLMDRGSLSMWAYQVYGDGMSVEEAAPYIDKDLADFDPDLIICYKAGLQTMRQRMKADEGKSDYFEKKGDSYFQRVIQGYDFAAERYGAVVIDAEAPLSKVHAQTMDAINQIL